MNIPVRNLLPAEHRFGWTDRHIERLKALWREGKSAGQIVQILGGGLSRNAVIGKIHRLGLAGRTKSPRMGPPRTRIERSLSLPRPVLDPADVEVARIRRALERAQRHAQRKVKARLGHAEALKAGEERRAEFAREQALQASVGITIADLTESTCRWPKGNPATSGFRYCGEAPEMGRPYCLNHCRIAYDGFGRPGRKLESLAAIV